MSRRRKAPAETPYPIDVTQPCKNQHAVVGTSGECLRCGADNAQACLTNDRLVRPK